MLSEEEVAQKQQQQQQMQMQQQQMQEEVMRANVRKVLAEAFKATSQARKNLDGSNAAMFNAVLSAALPISAASASAVAAAVSAPPPPWTA